MSLSAEKPILLAPVSVGKGKKELLVDPYNSRFKLIGWTAEEVARVGLHEIRSHVQEANRATKGIVYSQEPKKTAFETLGFNYEAVIEGYFANGCDAHVFSCFFDAKRGQLRPSEGAHESVRVAKSKDPRQARVPVSMTSRRATPNDADALHKFLAPAFDDYPTPMDPDYLMNAITAARSHFRVCMLDGDIVASTSAEIDHTNRNAEISDCVTSPALRGKGVVSALIQEVERDVHTEYGINHFYSLARAGEVGMNCAFAKCGYRYSGRLVNNCRMPNGWESIHVWCRSIEG